MTDTSKNDTERGQKPGVCPECGFRIDPDDEDVEVLDGWDFAHERC